MFNYYSVYWPMWLNCVIYIDPRELKRWRNREYYAKNKDEIAKRRRQARELKSTQQPRSMTKTWYMIHQPLDNLESANRTHHLQEVLFSKLARSRSHVTSCKYVYSKLVFYVQSICRCGFGCSAKEYYAKNKDEIAKRRRQAQTSTLFWFHASIQCY
jgi:hypothetical protein